MSASELGAVVIGAGIAGLGAALELRRRGVEVVLVDPGDRPGGVMRTEMLRGYRFERGPNTCQVKAPALGFFRDHEFEELLLPATPASRLRFLFHEGRLVPVPMSPVRFARSPLLGAGGKLRLLAEPFVRRGDGSGESVAEFMGRRLGHEASERLVGPFLVGIYAGDERELGAAAVFPSLVEFEARSGSILRGALASGLRRGRGRGLPGSFSSAPGLGGLATCLAQPLGEALVLGTRAVALAREGQGWRVEIDADGGTRPLRARSVVVATPADAAASLLRPLDAELGAALDSIVYAPVVSISVGVDPARARERIEGFGFLVPRAASLDLLGCLFMSRLFPGRAPDDRALLTCLLGGRTRPELIDLPDDTLCERLESALAHTLGLEGIDDLLGVTRVSRAVPQPGPRHHATLHAARSRLPAGLALAGSYLEGVSVADTLASGVRAAEEVAAA